MIKTKPKPAEQAITAPGFDYEGLPQDFASASRKRAEAIRRADTQAGRSIFDMGRILGEQRAAFGTMSEMKGRRGSDTWAAWLAGELGFGRDYATKLINIHERLHDDPRSASLGYHQMLALSTNTVTPDIKEKVLDMAARGDAPSRRQIEQMKKDAAGDDRPTPTEAKQRAKETGEVVIGSDNRFYTPMDEEAVEAHADKTQRTYDVLDAIALFAALPIDAETWLSEAEPHTLTDLNLGSIEAARTWLAQLAELYRNKEGIVDGN